MFTRARGGCVIQRCQNKNPRQKLGLRDVNDVMHRKLGIWEKAVSWVPASERESRDSELGEARRICALRAPCVSWVKSWRCKSSQHRKIMCLSPHVELPLNSKCFVPEPISCFRIMFIYMFMNILWTLCIFTNPSARAGYDTRSIFKRSLTGLNSEFSFS